MCNSPLVRLGKQPLVTQTCRLSTSLSAMRRCPSLRQPKKKKGAKVKETDEDGKKERRGENVIVMGEAGGGGEVFFMRMFHLIS